MLSKKMFSFFICFRAGELAGLKKVKLLKEPEAAALAYGLLQRQPQLVLIFDLGGGTFDVSVLEVGGGFVEVGSNRDFFLVGIFSFKVCVI